MELAHGGGGLDLMWPEPSGFPVGCATLDRHGCPHGFRVPRARCLSPRFLPLFVRPVAPKVKPATSPCADIGQSPGWLHSSTTPCSFVFALTHREGPPSQYIDASRKGSDLGWGLSLADSSNRQPTIDHRPSTTIDGDKGQPPRAASRNDGTGTPSTIDHR
ncbi:hypothetical protein BDK51DRAFT_49906 [Blyttiomyces helicus]|uniref:Uncharacterized protein n=1 Tax=Blyttiomyces helicus TaxID=388810 RepID=A0A4P9VV50_9FUNG|nr:hypothetical protein BDK51DRAFT_49906 [Blyttiomyces helicus]|eukprot:RKO83494.1 hypothetical protein BDK51DRAFT_49906 [Blyttiomyces helicus]